MNRITKSDLLGAFCLILGAIAYYFPSKYFDEVHSVTIVSMLVGGGLALLNGNFFREK
jgi:hypothetical protein